MNAALRMRALDTASISFGRSSGSRGGGGSVGVGVSDAVMRAAAASALVLPSRAPLVTAGPLFHLEAIFRSVIGASPFPAAGGLMTTMGGMFSITGSDSVPTMALRRALRGAAASSSAVGAPAGHFLSPLQGLFGDGRDDVGVGSGGSGSGCGSACGSCGGGGGSCCGGEVLAWTMAAAAAEDCILTSGRMTLEEAYVLLSRFRQLPPATAGNSVEAFVSEALSALPHLARSARPAVVTVTVGSADVVTLARHFDPLVLARRRFTDACSAVAALAGGDATLAGAAGDRNA
ncbi:unnamed protein product, partial [Phaeothamnion confervicola]